MTTQIMNTKTKKAVNPGFAILDLYMEKNYMPPVGLTGRKFRDYLIGVGVASFAVGAFNSNPYGYLGDFMKGARVKDSIL